MPSPMTHTRRRRLIQPALQLKLTLAFLCTAVLAVLLQSALYAHALLEPGEGGESVVSERLYALTWNNLAITLGVLVPLSLSIGILVTFRVAGPMYRFETFLRQVLAGAHPGPCVLRRGDEFQEFCGLLNQATKDLRVGAEPESARDESRAA